MIPIKEKKVDDLKIRIIRNNPVVYFLKRSKNFLPSHSLRETFSWVNFGCLSPLA